MKFKDTKKVEKEKVAVGETFAPTGAVLEKGFNKYWNGHMFVDDEIQKLLQGEEITIECKGDATFTGILEEQEYKGQKFWGFKALVSEKEKVGVGEIFAPTGKVLEKGFNKVWGGHAFTDDEVQRLLQGEEISIITSNNKPISGFLAQQTYKGNTFYGFMPGIPNEIMGHKITQEEKERMYKGELIHVDDLWSSKKATSFAGILSWDQEEKDLVLSFEDDDVEDEMDEEEPEEDMDDIDDSEEEI